MTAAALRSQYAAETANGAGYIWDERVQILEEGRVKKSGGNKAVLALLLALALVLVGSVAFFLIISRDGGAEAGIAQSAAVKPGKKDDKKKDELPEREGVFDENGVQTGYYLFDYDEEGHLIKEEEFGMDDQSNRWWEYTCSADGSETETRFYWQGEYTLRWIDYYGEDGVRTEQRSSNTEDALTEVGFCDGAGNIVRRESYQGPAGAEWKFEEAELDEEGRPVKARYFNEAGEPDGSFMMEYDAQGHEVRNVYYNAEGEFQWDSRSQYDENGNCVRREEYDERGKLEEYRVMKYNGDGKVQRDKLLAKLLNEAVRAEDFVLSEAAMVSIEDGATRDDARIKLADAVAVKDKNTEWAAALLEQVDDKEKRVAGYLDIGRDLFSFNETDAAIALLSGALEDKAVEALYDDCWLRKVSRALNDRDYNTALEAAEEVIGKTDEAAALCAEVYYAQAEDAMKAEDYATALDYYRSAGDVENAAAYTAVLDPLLDGFYFTAAEAVQANRDSMPTSTGGAFSRSRWASPRSLQMCWFRRR